MKKSIIVLLLMISVLFLGNITVSAKSLDNNENDESITITELPSSAPSEFYENPSDVLNGSLRSIEEPIYFWDLNSGDYYGNLIEVRQHWLYTNYYFLPNSSGILYLDYSIQPVEQTGTKMRIGVYNMSTGKFVKYYTSPPSPTAICIQVKDLNTNQHYAFAFLAIRDPLALNAVQGTIRVFN